MHSLQNSHFWTLNRLVISKYHVSARRLQILYRPIQSRYIADTVYIIEYIFILINDPTELSGETTSAVYGDSCNLLQIIYIYAFIVTLPTYYYHYAIMLKNILL